MSGLHKQTAKFDPLGNAVVEGIFEIDKTEKEAKSAEAEAKRQAEERDAADARAAESPNTAAASVDDTMLPSSNPSIHDQPSSTTAPHPTTAAVASTPTMDSDSAPASCGRASDQRVSMPPANRMNASATVPMVPVSGTLSKVMPPGPSEPASMPTPMNSSSAGTPSTPEALPARTLARSSVARATIAPSNPTPMEPV